MKTLHQALQLMLIAPDKIKERKRMKSSADFTKASAADWRVYNKCCRSEEASWLW
jgi:hypothetical protein